MRTAKCVTLHARVSTRDRDGHQLAEIRQLARRRGWKLVIACGRCEARRREGRTADGQGKTGRAL